MTDSSKFKTICKNNKIYNLYLNYLIKEDRKKDIRLSKRMRGPFVEKYFPKNGIGAELGVYTGIFSRILLENSSAKKLHLIDPWYFLTDEWDWSGGNPSTVDAVVNILKEFKPEINSGRVLVHIDDDLTVLRALPDQYFDWVYIDSSHEYEHTVKELELLQFKVKENGLIAGDDWRPDPEHRHHGVYKAVKEFINLHHYDILYADVDNLQWAIRKSSYNQP